MCGLSDKPRCSLRDSKPRYDCHGTQRGNYDDPAHRPTHQAQRGPPPAHRAGAVRGRHRAAGDGARRLPAQPLRHAHIRGIDVSLARQREGVFAVYTAEDLGAYWQHGPLLVPPPPVEGMTFHERTQVPLAKGKVRHVGEPVAVVVAISRYVAEDALQDIIVDYEALPAVVDLEKALDPGAALVHEDVGSNVAAYVPQRKGDYEAAKSEAYLIVRRRFSY